MTTLAVKRNSNKFCEFHGEVGHNTDECMHLKRQIEELIKDEKLSHVIKELKQGSGMDQPKAAKKGETFVKDKAMAILMDGTEGHMIIEAKIEGHFIHRIYVDGGSASEILYEHCFNRMRAEVKNQMIPATAPLIGFSEEIIWPMGQISLPMKIEDAEHSTSTWMNFVVVRSPSPYNGIIGRLGVRKIQAVPSTAYGMLKFPVPGGILALRSNKIIPLECTMVSRPKTQPFDVTQATEERIKVAIHLEYPEQTIAIGSTLTEEAEHRLNVREGCPPVRQKKRSQTPERNKAIQEEVHKLVDVGIIKEVHYHSWLSNPVMVKKHDNSWRMCVDFRDLNKACPKDRYPLLEIDWKVESPYGYPFKSFLDTYKGYHQIKMAKEDEENTAFITSQGIFCYSKMHFGLKNASGTYQCLVYKAFQKQIGRNLEVKRSRERILMTEREAKQMPIYFVSRAIQDLEINYTPMERLVLALVRVSKRLKRYFQAHTIIVITDQLIKQVLSKQEIAGRLHIWSIELGEYDIHCRPRISIKRQILAEFIVERSEYDSLVMPMEVKEELPDPWTLFTNGSSCVDGSGTGLILINPKGT
uniref:Reverse transcriptase domain-containing protein n=1 Tax=Tanacetum cinerariifolium TaxID=118510 RepID=A0A6L2M059_TANCI|nr:reverse transcriptase domain-containing protein [Tanacetum cinerariifolium]